jgi:ribokinase
MKLDVIGFGALNLDRLYRVVQIAGAGEESYITRYTEASGGSAANTIVGLARLGVNVGCIGKLAGDLEGRRILSDLINEKVNINGIVVSEDGASGVVLCFVDEGGERTMYVQPSVNNELTQQEIDVDYGRNTKFLHLSSFISKKPFEAQQELLNACDDVQVSLDPGMYYATKGIQALRPILKRCLTVFPNEREVQLLTGEKYVNGARVLLREGPKIVAVKLGSKGCYVTDGVEEHFIEAYEVKVVDTTGAGDAFCAGFLYGLLKGKDLYACGELGNYVASRKIGIDGARDGLPNRSDIPRHLR